MAVKVLAKRGTAAQIEGAASSVQSAGEIAFATDTKDFYVSDGTQFNKITDLESNGNLSVGNDLFVNGDKLIFTNDSAAAYLQSADTLVLESDYDSDDNPGGKPILFRVSGDTKMVINGRDGNVGIGTTSPTSPLHVAGNLFVDGSSLKVVNNSVTNYYDSDRMNSYGTYYDWRFAGNTKMRITSTGNVGIGTTSPGSSYKLDVEGNTRTNGYHVLGATGDIRDRNTHNQRFEVSSTYSSIKTSNTHRLYVTSTGNVGIGTTSPTSILDIENDSGVTIDLNSSSGDSQFRFQDGGVTKWAIGRDNTQQNFVFSNTAGLGSDPVLVLEHGTGNVDLTGNLTVTKSSATIKAIETGGGDVRMTAGGATGYIGTYNNNSLQLVQNGNVALFVDTSKNIGIGTTSLSEKLHVGGGGNIRVDGSEIYITQASSSRRPVRLHQAAYKGAITLQRDGVDNVHISSDLAQQGHTYFNGLNTNVGIGTDAPTQKLQVQGSQVKFTSTTSGENRFMFSSGDDGNNSAFYMYDSQQSNTILINSGGNSYFNGGNVGIGTTSPSHKLDVNGDINIPLGSNYLRFGGQLGIKKVSNGAMHFYPGTNSSTGGFDFATWNGSSYNEGSFVIRNNGRVGIGTTSPSRALHVLTTGWNGILSESSTTNGALIRIKNAQREFELSSRSDSFQIRDITDSDTNRFIINSLGNVGIGAISPDAKLHIQTGEAGTPSLNASHDDVLIEGSGNIGIQLFSPNTSYQYIAFGDPQTINRGYIRYYHGGDAMVFRTAGSDKMIINSAGNVGIGNTSPATKIDVDGTGRITDTVYLSTNTNSKTGIGTTSPTHKLDVKGDISADEFLQAPSGIPRVNLGDPTVTEMALFESQMSCKTDLSDDYTDLTKVTFWQQPNEGDAWSQVTVSDDNKKKFLRTNNSSIVIPNGTYRYRIEFEPKSYRSAQAFYCYHSYRGNAFAVHVWKRRCSDNQWFQHTDSDVEVGKWPGHLYLPMDAIFWHPTDTTSTYRYNLIRIEFIPNWSASNTYNIDLLGGQLWGGYPAGKRTPHTYNHDGQLTLPANLIVPDDLIVNSGNVGIGTTSPQAKLDVEGIIFSRNKFILSGSSGSSTRYAAIEQNGTEGVFRLYNGSNWGFIARGVGNDPYIGAYREGSLRIRGFGQSGGGDDATDKDLAIFDFANERVGIGTYSPAGTLHVVGASGGAGEIYVSDVDNGTGSSDGLLISKSGTNAFIYNRDNGQMSFGTNNVSNNLVITNTGNVGIGTTNPYATLTVAGNITQTDNSYLISTRKITARGAEGLALYNDGGKGIDIKDNNGDVVIADGNVGIGTTNLSYKFNVNSGNAETVGFFKSTDSRARILISDDDTNTYVGSENGYGFFGGQASLSTGNLVINSTNGNVGIGTINPPYKLTVQGSAYVYGGNLNIPNGTYGIVNAGNTSQKLYFPSLGNFAFENVNVGIGTAAPTEKLEVSGNIRLSGNIVDANTGERIQIGQNDIRAEHKHLAAEFGLWARSSTLSSRFMGIDGSATYMGLFTNNSEKVRIDSTGNVGIGTTSPAAKLQVVHTDASKDTLVLGRTDNSSYWKVNHAGNDFRLYNRDSSGADILFGVDAGGITQNNRVGIGTALPSEKLEVSGNIKASGTIKGKMEQMFACSFSDDLGTTKHYLSFTSNAEQTNVHADQAAMVMPYNGRVKSIQMRLSNIDADAIRTFGIETIAPGINMYASSNNWTIEETESYELFAADDFYLINYVFSNENHFEAGDLLAISIQDNEDAYTASRQTYVNVIIEYDLNNGMGNDTSTTKYTS